MLSKDWGLPPEPFRFPQVGAGRFPLPGKEVHLWRVVLDHPDEQVEALWETLSPDERERAQRFRFPRDRRRFAAARGALRSLLGRYLACDPACLRFVYGEAGKPALPPAGGGDPPLRFNLSHSSEVALIAVSGREVGVDVEAINPNLALGHLAARFYSPAEQAWFRSLSPERRPLAFYQIWTGKEAFLKAKGLGLGLPLDRFDVLPEQGGPSLLCGCRWDAGEVDRWALRPLQPGAGYAGAVAAEGHDWTMRCWQYPPLMEG